MRCRPAWFALVLVVGCLSAVPLAARPRPAEATGARAVRPSAVATGDRTLDDADRTAFRRWFTFLADAQFERRTDDVTDCAALVRHAYREALRAHTPDWYRRSRVPRLMSIPDVRAVPAVVDGAWRLFRVSAQPARFAEFADAATLIRFNTRLVGREVAQARPGDLLYFHQDGASSPDHLMVVVGPSVFDADRRDWLVYHTGPDGTDAGEVRKVALADLARHPAPRWRPIAANPAFVGVFRLAILDAEGPR